MKRVFRGSVLVSFALATLVAACGWDPARPFDREAPQVNEALRFYDAGEAGTAAELLQEYLATGVCHEGNIGTPLRIRERPNGTFDLGLSLFEIAEAYGHRFGDEENDAGFLDPNTKTMRGTQVDCALRVVRAIAEDAVQPPQLRGRARYLEGNLLFLTAAYKEAVTAYDAALELLPAMGDGGPIGTSPEAGANYVPDPVGRDAAWNRAVALRRIEDKNDAGNDGGPPDGGNDPDGGKNDKNKDGGKDDKNKDAGKDSGKDDDKKDSGKDDKKDSGKDDKEEPKKDPKNEPDAGPPPPPPPSRQSQDDRILDQLENAPTVQQEAAKKQARSRRVRGMADK